MNLKRLKALNEKGLEKGPVVYWMSRDQRVQDNWALLHAFDLADKNKQPLVVVFCLVKNFLESGDRQFGFMIDGLKQVEKDLAEKNIVFRLIKGEPTQAIPHFVNENKAGILVTDFSPLKIGREWREEVAEKVNCAMVEVDAHNIVPVWEVSSKQEFGAYTIRPKIHKLLPEFLEEFPKLKKFNGPTLRFRGDNVWSEIKSDLIIESGEVAAQKELGNFLSNKLSSYDEHRNDPNEDAQSNLSPYLHFGQISAQRIAIEVLGHTGKLLEEVMLPDRNGSKRESNEAAFLEELVVRRELSDNFCFYNKNYDSPEGFPVWAKQTILEHQDDDREFIYSLKEFEQGKTHDDLWNAAQQQMVKSGKMHGYMRMYWAKKILEWTPSAKEAMDIAIYLNDKYELDGRDPNGYAGIAWSIGGVHDRAWFERKIFGKIRYMSYGGCKNKFGIKEYIKRWKN